MSEPVFLQPADVIALHDAQIAQFGGSGGVRDLGLIESAVAQPQQLYCFDDEADIFDMAAAYAFHIAKNHGFVDGNKRTGLIAALTFLGINGLMPVIPDSHVVDGMMVALTEDRLSKADFAAFLCVCSMHDFLTADDVAKHRSLNIQEVAARGVTFDEAMAILIDELTTAVRATLINKCERHCVNPARVQDFPTTIEAIFFPHVREDLRRAFGMA